MPDARRVLSLEEYLAEVLSLVSPLSGVEDVPLAHAAGRTLAGPVTSRAPVPAFRNSAMDGFAVRSADLAPGAVLRVVADLPAGAASDPALEPGSCARIMTGAPVPTDADTVVPVELTTPVPDADPDRDTADRAAPHADRAAPHADRARRDPLVRLDQVPPAGAHVREAGEDLAAGDVVLAAGTTLGPRELAAAAAAGAASVPCARRPVVGVVSTGDELVAPGAELGRGQVYESNATYLAAAAARDGAVVLRAGPVGDTADALRAALDSLCADADLVVLSGGVSVGDHDVARLTLAEADEVALRHVRMQPGKPQGWARWRAAGRLVPVVALPGNPLSTAVSYELFVRPAVARLLGKVPAADAGAAAVVPTVPRWEPAIAGEAWASPAGRRQVLPVRLAVTDDGLRVVRPAHRRGSASHMVTSLAAADALAQVAEDVTDVRPGDVVSVRSLS